MRVLFYSFAVMGCLLLFPNFSNGQAYIRASFGPGLGVSPDAFGVPALTRDSNEIVVEQRTIFGSFGNGIRASLTGGYWFTPSFGAELGVYYFGSFRQAYGSSVSASGSYYDRSGYSYQVRLAPSLVVRASEGKIRPFGRFGIVLPAAGVFILEETTYTANNQRTRQRQTDIEGKFSLGFESSFGAEYHISDRVSVTAQVTYSGLRIKASRATVVQDLDIQADGSTNDQLESAPVIMRQIEFQDVLTKESNINPLLQDFFTEIPRDIVIQIDGTLDFDRPLNLPTESINSNSLFFEVGIQYTFAPKAD